MKKFISAITLSMLIFSGYATAGEYTQEGYVKQLKANIQGSVCDITLTDSSGKYIQGGQWACDSTIGRNMLRIAELAKVFHYKVEAVLEGNGDDYRPVYSITIVE